MLGEFKSHLEKMKDEMSILQEKSSSMGNSLINRKNL